MIIRGNYSRSRLQALLDVPVCRTCELLFRADPGSCPECGNPVTRGIADGDILIGNFHQSNPHTDVSGVFGALDVEVRGNGLNCEFPETVTHSSGLGAGKIGGLHKELCSHIHANRLATGEISQCPDNCDHVIGSDEVVVDGVSLGVIRRYADKVVD